MENYKRYILLIPSVMFILLTILLNFIFSTTLKEDDQKLALPSNITESKEKLKSNFNKLVTTKEDSILNSGLQFDSMDIYQMEPEPPFEEENLVLPDTVK